MERLLIYVEDPGAANFVLPLLPELPPAGWEPCLYASGLALPYLADRNCTANELSGDMSGSALIDGVAPGAVMVGTSENVDSRAFEITTAAAGKGVVSVAVVDGPANVESRFRGRSDAPLRHAPDWLFLTDGWTKDRYAEFGFPADRLVVTGHPYYDQVRREGMVLRCEGQDSHRKRVCPDAPPDAKIIMFLSETSQGLGIEHKRRASDYTLNGWGDSDLRTHIVMEEFLDAVAELDERPYLVLRLHPKDAPETYADQLSHFDAVSQGGQALPQLFAADLVVGLSTSLLVEAQIAGLNTLSILPRENERNFILSVREGTTPCATTPKEIRSLLAELLADWPGEQGAPAPGDEPSAIRSVLGALERLH